MEAMEEVPRGMEATLTDYVVQCCTTMTSSSANTSSSSNNGSSSNSNAAQPLLWAMLARPDSVEALAKFAAGGETSSVLLVEDATASGGEFTLRSDVSRLMAASCPHCVVFIKHHDGPLLPQHGLHSQVQVLTLAPGDGLCAFFAQLQQLTKHLYIPLARAAGQQQQQHADSGTATDAAPAEHMAVLQKRFRELESALEQCQRSAVVPRVMLAVPPAVEAAARRSTAQALRGYLEKYNSAQVDLLFQEIGVPDAATSSAEHVEAFANDVGKATKAWPAEIAKQTRLVDSAFPSSAEQEMGFWKDLEAKLDDTKNQLGSPEVLLAKLVLKRNNRVSEQLLREAEADVDRCADVVQASASFLREFPVDELSSAEDLHPPLTRSITLCLQHFSRLKHSRYDFGRAVRLLEVVGTALFARMATILREKHLLSCPIDDVRHTKTAAEEVFAAWDTHYTAQRGMLKDVAKRKKETLRPMHFDNVALQQRLAAVVEFREQHERMLSVFSAVLTGQGEDAQAALLEAFQLVARQMGDSAMDTSDAGARAWQAARQLYEQRLERAEERVTRLLEDRLGAAQTADDMFRVFSTFNPLFFRPAIRNAVNSFRAALVKNVREDVRRLQDKFRLRYDDSLERATADLRDIPQLSGRIIWARQIETQLATLMRRMEDVLGAGWEDHFEGKQLKEVCDELKNYLDTDQLYKEWLSTQLKSDLSKYSKMRDFLLLVEDDPRTGRRTLRVNFDDRQVEVFKEVRFLEWLLPGMSTTHKNIPSTLLKASREAYVRYPVATALQAALAGFAQAKHGITSANALLLTAHVGAVREVVKEAIGGSTRTKRWIKWDSPDLEEWVGHFSNKVFALQDKVDDLTDKATHVESFLTRLRSCPYRRDAFLEVVEGLQAVVDDVQIRGFSNVAAWVAALDRRVEATLLGRLQDAVTQWTAAFARDCLTGEADDDADSPRKRGSSSSGSGNGGRARAASGSGFGSASKARRPAAAAPEPAPEPEHLTLTPTVHEVLLSNQLLFVAPPLAQARVDWLRAFHQHLAVVCTLPRLSSSRFNVFAGASDGPADYGALLSHVDAAALRGAFVAMEDKLAAAHAYVATWLQYQALWDASATALTERLGRDLAKWQQLLQEIKSARGSVDGAEEEASFGPIVVNHRQVQSRVHLKYDSWQKEAQARFGAILAEEIKAAHADLAHGKAQLEGVLLDGPTKDVIAGVELILSAKTAFEGKKQLVAELDSSERLLQRQRFQFPRDWMPVSNVAGVLGDFRQILDRRAAAMDAQLPALQQKVREEDLGTLARTDDFLAAWEAQRPARGGLAAQEALSTLSMFAAQATTLAEDAARIRGAREALGLDGSADDRVSFVAREIADLRDVWQLVAPVYEQLHSMRATPVRNLNATKVRKQLDEVSEQLRAFPAKAKSYAAVEWALETIATRQAAQPVLRDLGTEALKDRHWRGLLAALGLSAVAASALTVGHVWDSNLLAHKKTIQDVLATAQGEQALEQFLRDLREQWVGAELSLAMRDGVRLVVGWDALFTALEDNLNSLASLKQSPYFRNVPEFQEDTTSWEARLTNLRGILEVWVEVQRKWVYLRGIFRNADIKAQLPIQFGKFKGVDNEFLAVMKRVAAKPTVLDVLQVDNMARQLERQDSTMTLIQKALGEYLERQRQIFPRFYFVNNDDLVEIIGNSNEPAKVAAHLGKMFAAVVTLEMTAQDVADESDTAVVVAPAMCSKEGESVAFTAPLPLTGGVKEWLGQLETAMVGTLEAALERALASMPPALSPSDRDQDAWLSWTAACPAQVAVLACQLAWCRQVEAAWAPKQATATAAAAGAGAPLPAVLAALEDRLRALSESVLRDLPVALRRKCEHLLTEMVHQRDVTRLLVGDHVADRTDFAWVYHLRFYWAAAERRLEVRMANAAFTYGFEYLGVAERLVQTPLTDRCYLTLTQALHYRMGANPFGPAGTGKTETVKMLGAQLGRFVLVFNCDSSFDYAAMGRIFAGLCQVGAWGCFDEFNRLEERILSAVSQQILTIQRGLLARHEHVELLGAPCKLRPDVGIFVTLNPGYAGRSNLPDNLKQLFRAVAMVVPDRKMIAQVMLYSQGLVTAEALAGKVVLLFTLCEEQLSAQPHYDFGLRALKSVLVGAGDLKRLAAAAAAASGGDAGDDVGDREKGVLIKSICDSLLPKLVREDIPLYTALLQAVFPGCALPPIADAALVAAVEAVCVEDGLESSPPWVEKVLQLKQVLDMRHGVMMVGPTGAGKSTAWRTLLKALGRVDGVKGDYHVIDPKAVKKEKLYGSLDPHTLEWTDGIFTKILRKVADNSSGRAPRRSWIVFDGDVDPDWAENLNSVLDDNKVLTLPSGDRLKLPPTVRVVMEVDSLQHATMATVSRCGMVWFADGTVAVDVVLRHVLQRLRRDALGADAATGGSALSRSTQAQFVDCLGPHFSEAGLVGAALNWSLAQPHVMDATLGRLVTSLHALVARGVAMAVEYNEANSDFPLSPAALERFAQKWLLHAALWGCGGSLSAERRAALGDLLVGFGTADPLPLGCRLVDVQVTVDGAWAPWAASVPKIEIEAHKCTATDVVIPTTDTLRHTEVLRAWLAAHRPCTLCGPPGSGKTMTLTAVLESMPADFILAPLNFSSTTSPDLILKTFAQYCETEDSPDGLVMQPNKATYRESQWLVVFCDEINLPETDAYGSQRVVMFLRQLTEQGGYWNGDCKWVSLRRVQFVGACNPPTDAGRVPLPQRFLRHAPVLLVDYPAEESLLQVYRCFNHALLKLHPNLRGALDPLNGAMVDLYLRNQRRFTADVAPQYVYSPRELSRWVRAMYEAMEPLEAMTTEELVRLWAHEALRLFHDRLVTADERAWCESAIDEVAAAHFPAVDLSQALQRPLLYSNWLRRTYQSTGRDELRDFVAARLKVFYEEELDVPLVIFDDVLEHVLRIDNVLRHPMGHLLLVGESGVGKTVLSRFVAWMNGLSVFQIKTNSKYTVEHFEEDLRGLLRRVGVDGEKVCFIFDEGNVLSSAFLERMNALLASGEVPGLFEGDDRSNLLAACRESFSQRGEMLDAKDELWRRFTQLVQRNLHVVFTMNPASADFSQRCTASPALFNRCVVDWFGTWSGAALAQVGAEFTMQIDTGFTPFSPPKSAPRAAFSTDGESPADVLATVVGALGSTTVTLSEAVVAALVCVHRAAIALAARLGRVTGRPHYLSPRDYLDLIKKFVDIEGEKRGTLEEQQTHIRTGLQKLLETQDKVADLRGEMASKDAVLKAKDAEANEKLGQMVARQNEAEQRKRLAEELTVELQRQNEEIRVRREAVEVELSEAEPALAAAKQSVQNIRKTQLDEVRQLARPPNAVRLTMEMVSIMIGEKNTEWTEIRKVIRREDFIATVVTFDPLTLTAKQVKDVQDTYLSNAELDYASVDRASKACGPLYMWAESQIRYATILRKVKPLRDEVTALTEQSAQLADRQKEAVQQVGELEQSITQYKAEYAAAIREGEAIRAERDVVSKKTDRAEALLQSLAQEKERWERTSADFDAQMSTLIGDSLLAGAFLTYCGAFDHRMRKGLAAEWCDALDALGVPFQENLDVVPFLSRPADQLEWRGCGLPADELATQNAILLARFNRYPLIVDPSGQATTFILAKFAAHKIAQTSFLDAAFLKSLASAIRFGAPLLVHDVESIDPILNPVLNKELQKTGGRTLIRLGAEDIDFSPRFLIFLTTRNPTAHFAPDLCSRVTLVNFTVTPASLEAQALSAILKAERPDVDARRTETLRLQSVQSVQLRALEESLLSKISAVQGAILDDDSVINSLETIQREAAQLSKEVAQTLEMLAQVTGVSSSYEPLSRAMAAVYFSLAQLGDMDHLYQFSLPFFLGIVDRILTAHAPPAGAATSAPTAVAARIQVLGAPI